MCAVERSCFGAIQSATAWTLLMPLFKRLSFAIIITNCKSGIAFYSFRTHLTLYVPLRNPYYYCCTRYR